MCLLLQLLCLSNKWLPVFCLKVDVLQENIAKIKGTGAGESDITQDNRKLQFIVTDEFLEQCDGGDLECKCLGFFDKVEDFIKVSFAILK